MKPVLDDTAVKVEGKGRFNFNNRNEAETLFKLLMEYQNSEEVNKETAEKLDKITRQVIQIQMSIKIVDSEIKQLKKMVEGGQ